MEVEEKHPGQWLYEEGMAYYYGSDFKKQYQERGRMMVEASASSGFSVAVAHFVEFRVMLCHTRATC